MNDQQPEYTYRATGSLSGYPSAVTIFIQAANIEEAHDEAAERLDEVYTCSGPLHTEAKQ